MPAGERVPLLKTVPGGAEHPRHAGRVPGARGRVRGTVLTFARKVRPASSVAGPSGFLRHSVEIPAMDDYEARAAAAVESAVSRLAARRTALTPQQLQEVTETLLRLADRIVPPELRAVLGEAGEGS